MYAVGNLPDHVTRYNHKDTNRWMVQRVRRDYPSGVCMMVKVMSTAVAVAGLILTSVMMLQGGGML